MFYTFIWKGNRGFWVFGVNSWDTFAGIRLSFLKSCHDHFSASSIRKEFTARRKACWLDFRKQENLHDIVNDLVGYSVYTI